MTSATTLPQGFAHAHASEEVDDEASRLRAAAESSDLPAEPNLTWVNDWLHRHHLAYWRTLEVFGC